MASSLKITANQANAQRSTGPRSAAGKRQSRLNAIKHGLAMSVPAVPELSQEVISLTQAIAGEDQGNVRFFQAATLVAEAAIDLLRVRRVKTELYNGLSSNRGSLTPLQAEAAIHASRQSGASEVSIWEQLERLERYERRALSRRNSAIRAFNAARAAAQKDPPG